MKKLSKPQQKLLDAMRRGVRVIFIRGYDSYAFRADNHRRCTMTAMALLRAGKIERSNEDFRGYELLVKAAAKTPGKPQT